MTNKVAVIIPVRNSGHYLKLTIDSILKTFKYPYKIILIESDSTDGTAEYCDQLTKEHDFIEVYHIPKGGTTKAYNFGIQKAGDLDVLLTQDDVIFFEHYGKDLLTSFINAAINESNGILTVQNGGGVSGPLYANGFHWAGTWCMFIPRRTINKIGMLDENLNPGDGDDIDYSYLVVNSGMKIGVLEQMFVNHHRKLDIANHEYESQEIKAKNSAYFKHKWSIVDPTLVAFSIGGVNRTFNKQSLNNLNYNLKDDGFKIYWDVPVFKTVLDVTKNFKDDDVYLDIGACVGDTAMWITKGTCFAFEPSDRGYKGLLTNCALNPNAKVVPLKLAAFKQHVKYQIKEGSHFGLDEITNTTNPDAPETIVIDEMFKSVPNIKLIKIDCEGADQGVLEGCKEVIKKNKPTVLIEINHSDKKAILKIFEELNYDAKIYDITCIGTPK